MFYCLYYVFFQDFKTLKQPGSPFSSHTSSYLTMAVSDTHFVHLLQTNFPNVTFSPLLEKNNSHLSSMKTNHLFFHGLQPMAMIIQLLLSNYRHGSQKWLLMLNPLITITCLKPGLKDFMDLNHLQRCKQILASKWELTSSPTIRFLELISLLSIHIQTNGNALAQQNNQQLNYAMYEQYALLVFSCSVG